METRNSIYRNYEGLINKRVWQIMAKYHLRQECFDDVKSFGNECYCLALKNFDHNKGFAFTTYLWHNLRRMDEMVKNYFFRDSSEELNEEIVPDTTLNSKVFEEALKDLDSQHIRMLEFVEKTVADNNIIIKQASRDIPMLFHDLYGITKQKSKQLWQDVRLWFNSREHIAE